MRGNKEELMRTAATNEGNFPDGKTSSLDPRALALASELREDGIRGEVRFDRGSRALYATDYSIYR